MTGLFRGSHGSSVDAVLSYRLPPSCNAACNQTQSSDKEMGRKSLRVPCVSMQLGGEGSERDREVPLRQQPTPHISRTNEAALELRPEK